MTHIKKFRTYGLHKDALASTSKTVFYEKVGFYFLLICRIKGRADNKKYVFYLHALPKNLGKAAKREFEYFERIIATLTRYLNDKGFVATYIE